MFYFIGGPWFEGDTVVVKGKFESDGVDQIPDDGSCKVSIFKEGSETPVVDDVQGYISGSILFYPYANVAAGEYVAYISAEFSQGLHRVTGEVKFLVKQKRGVW